MDYRIALKQLIEEYRDGIMEIYQVTTTAAMKDAKSWGYLRRENSAIISKTFEAIWKLPER